MHGVTKLLLGGTMFKQSKRNLSIYLIALVVLLGGGTWAAAAYQSQSTPEVQTTEQTEKPDRTRTEITYIATAGVSSLAQLKDEADNVIVKNSEYGDYVDSIESHQGGTDGKYWSFYIDGKLSTVGAGSYTQKGGEKIVWKFQKL